MDTTTQQVQRTGSTLTRRSVLAAIMGVVLVGGAAIGVRAATGEPQTTNPPVVQVTVAKGHTQPTTLILQKTFHQQPKAGHPNS
jgi:hypothetical protein